MADATSSLISLSGEIVEMMIIIHSFNFSDRTKYSFLYPIKFSLTTMRYFTENFYETFFFLERSCSDWL